MIILIQGPYYNRIILELYDNAATRSDTDHTDIMARAIQYKFDFVIRSNGSNVNFLILTKFLKFSKKK